MIYIFRSKFSEGASLLADELNDLGAPARYTQGRALERFREGRDRLVYWGQAGGPIVGLNRQVITSKFADAITLRAAGVPTIEVSLTVPPVPVRGRYLPQATPYPWTEEQVRAELALMQAYLNAAVPAPTWLGRRNNHVGGSDLLAPPTNPDYYSKKEDISNEYRLHMFAGKSIRAGLKRRRDLRPDGTPSHDWIRSFDAGWIIAYEDFKSRKAMRDIAAQAVSVLGLDFGAVDLAQRADGSLIVLEVNRAPGLEGGTVTAYANAIRAWAAGAAGQERV